jgi:hypothetical protein
VNWTSCLNSGGVQKIACPYRESNSDRLVSIPSRHCFFSPAYNINAVGERPQR